MNESIIELDIHGKNVYQAKVSIDSCLRRCKGAYRIRVIHGHRGGITLRDFVRNEYANNSYVLRIEYKGDGITELVLRELW